MPTEWSVDRETGNVDLRESAGQSAESAESAESIGDSSIAERRDQSASDIINR